MITTMDAIEVLTNSRDVFGSEGKFAEAIDLAVDRLRNTQEPPEVDSEAWARTGGF